MGACRDSNVSMAQAQWMASPWHPSFGDRLVPGWRETFDLTGVLRMTMMKECLTFQKEIPVLTIGLRDNLTHQ